MERELPPYRAAVTKPTRSNIWPTLIVGLTLAAIIAGGFQLLGKTRHRWEASRTERVQRQEAFEEQWRASQATPAQQQADRARPREPLRNPNLRCINGQLFRKLPNGWENIPGERC
jgi:hypothetical protein